MTRQSANYPPEQRERAMRMVAEVRPDYPSERAAIGAVAQKLAIGSSETLRKWIRQAEIDGESRPGVTSEESAEIKRLKRENAELRGGRKRPDEGRVVLVLPDSAGPPGVARRCSESEPVPERSVTAKPGSNLTDMGPVFSAQGWPEGCS